MRKKTFEDAFQAVFHNKVNFSEFCSIDIESEITCFEIDDRKIFKPSDQLKQFLRFVDKVVLRQLDQDTDVVHSFVSGRNTLSAVKVHERNNHFFLTDIRSFYASITSGDVRALLHRDKRLLPISDIEHYVEKVVEITTYGDSLPVGFPTSPKLSNAFLLDFDKAVKNHCVENDLTYTRYADDLIISGQSFEELSSLKSEIQNILSATTSNNLLLKDSKTRITHLGNRVKILGLIILPDGSITIDSKYKKKIELALHFYATNKDKYVDFLNHEFKGDERSLFGLLHYAKSVDSSYIGKIQRKYGIFSLNSLMDGEKNGGR
jgi:RNA-directed DNA polymerase